MTPTETFLGLSRPEANLAVTSVPHEFDHQGHMPHLIAHFLGSSSKVSGGRQGTGLWIKSPE